MSFCYTNGRILKDTDAKISIKDIGFLRGFGLYEALTSFGGEPFMFDDHLDRFENGAKFLNLKIPEIREDIKGIVSELLRKNIETEGIGRYNIKFILTGGQVIGGIDYDFEKPTFCIITEKFNGLPSNLFTDGVKIITEEYEREFPEVKTTNYTKAVMLQKKMKERGAFETLYFKNGKILECTTSNIFIIKNEILITPENNVLKGITRKAVLKFAKENGIKTEEKDVSLEELFECDEIFITASFKEALPVVCVDDKSIKDGKVGKMTLKVMEIFKKEIEKI